MKREWEEIFRPYLGERKLNIGCGFSPETGPGWVNLDMNPAGPAEVIHDVSALPMPFAARSFDTVLASHVLEHLEKRTLIDLVYDVARVLKIGGHFIIIVPHGANDAAWENPHHRQLFTETTFEYFDKRLYLETNNSAGAGAGQGHSYAKWSQMMLRATPTKEWIDRPAEEISAAVGKYRNVLEEMQVVLRLEER